MKKGILKKSQEKNDKIRRKTSVHLLLKKRLCELSKSAFFTGHLWTNASARRYGIDNFVM